jgi:2-keto-4-pentenoate hydratase/2-oxohepta-3-ene-1,7-dioic acid hydratase in catechol pathway
MKLVRYLRDGKEGYGIHEDEHIQPVDGLFEAKKAGKRFKASEAALLAPCVPQKIICCGLNYKDHAAEMHLPIPREPIIFLKAPTAVLAPGGVIRYPRMSRRVEYEAELGIVIGRAAREITPDQAAEHILGYTCFNDVTARDLQKKDGQWARAKSFDTFAPFGPCIETELDPADVLVEAYLNGKLKQSSSTSNMKFTVDIIVSFISMVMTLLPGDVIATGTPPGIGPMRAGDEIEVRISGIGSLINTVGI